MTAYAWLKTAHLVFVIRLVRWTVLPPEDLLRPGRWPPMTLAPAPAGDGTQAAQVHDGAGVSSSRFRQVLWGGYGVGANAGWMYAKLVLVLGVVVYHAYCAVLYRRVASGSDNRSASWYRWFNEIPVLMLFAIVALVIGKPF